MECEDDLLFADLSKRISLLIMDDAENPVANHPYLHFQDFSRQKNPTASFVFTDEQICRRESKGTGVFIPKMAEPRRKNWQRRHLKTRNNKQNDNTIMVSHQVSSKNSLR